MPQHTLNCNFSPAVLFLGRISPQTALVIFSTTFAGATTSQAAAPLVYFDLDSVVACRDVTPDEFTAMNPDEKLVEAAFDVSSLIRHGSEDDLLQYFYRLESPDRALRIVDYSPQTTLSSDQAGNVTIEKKNEQNNHAGVTVSGPVELPIRISGSGDLGGKTLDTVRYELVPQSIVVAAAGTIQNGHGVYFKLKPSRSSTLEGSKRFTTVLRVTKMWRGGCVQLTCTSRGMDRGVVRPLDEEVTCGNRRFVISLYLEGDAEAKSAAERLSRAESELWQTVSAQHKAIERCARPTFVHKVGVLFDMVPPEIPEDWTRQLVYGSQSAELGSMAPRLPETVRRAVVEYTLARRDLRELGRAL